MTAAAIDQFREALRARNIIPPAKLLADGELHRCDADGKNGKGDAAYVLHLDGVPAGGLENHRDGQGWENWTARVGRKLSPVEAAVQLERVAAAKKKRDEEQSKRHAKVAANASALWEAAAPAPADHSYLRRKGIEPHGARVYRGDLVIGGMQCDGALMIRMRDLANVTHDIQFIAPDGEKRFLPGGRKRGLYCGLPGDRDKGVLLCEGFATGASVFEVTEQSTLVAFDSANLEPVARALREAYPDLRITICADDDHHTPANPGLTKGVEAARAVGALIARPEFGADRLDDWKDFNDLHRRRGADAVRQCVENAQAPGEDKAVDQAQEDAATLASREIEKIAALPPIEYERNRTDVAKRLRVRATALDRLTAKAREKIQRKQTLEQMFGTVEPWGQPVDCEALLADLAQTFERFVVLPKHAAVALALWVLLTYSHDAFQHSPLLLARSATKRCGKTTLVLLLAELAHRPMPASNLTPAVIFRVVEEFHPTLLIDEVDSFLEVSEELRGILNSGHQRGTAMVYRTEEINGRRQIVGFSTWAPKLLAMIGRPPSTILDRSISIHMRRKLRGDKVEKRRHAALDTEGMRSRCARWAADNAMALAEARPEIPDELNDRQADSWEPLLAIAERAGATCGALAREAAVALCLADKVDLDQAELGEELLRDIRGLFDDKARRKLAGEVVEDPDRMSSNDMVNALLALDARPWSEAHHRRPITQNWLGRRLSAFGVLVKNVRFAAGRVLRGYTVEAFEDAWGRYLSD